MALLAQVALLAMAAMFLVAFCRQPSVFVVRVSEDAARTVKGKVTQAFLDDVRDVCRQHQVTAATVRGVARGARIALVFSRSIPEPGRQQLRNVWAASGWGMKPFRDRNRGGCG